MSKKRILVFHNTIAPYRLDFFNDLSARFDTKIYLYYRNLKSQKFDYDKLSDRFLFEPHYMKKKKIKLFGREAYSGHISAIREWEPDIVLGNEYKATLWKTLIFRFFRKKKYKIFTICDDSIQVARDCSVIRKISRFFLLKFIDGVILCNKDALEWYKRKFPGPDYIYFPIIQKDESFRECLKSSLELSKDYIRKYNLQGCKIFLYVGRISPVKNLVYLVESFLYACRNDDTIRLVLVGDVTTAETERKDAVTIKETIERMVNTSDFKDRVIMTGRLEGNDLYAWYNVGQVFVLPSKTETFGAVVNEALLAGEYAMVSKNAGSVCLIDDSNGEVIDIDKERISFDKAADRIDCIRKLEKIRESRMNITYDQLLSGLIEVLGK